jgi:PI-3-kinase-related kinase SMG-1
VLSSGALAIPATTWLPVLPQLMALAADKHASTPDSPSARVLLHTLHVCMGVDPAAVLLPALVQVQQEESLAAAAVDAESSAVGGELSVVAPSLCQMLTQTTAPEHSELWAQLQALSRGLSQLAVLWEEHWHSLLQEALAVASKRLMQQQLEQEGAATDNGAASAVNADVAAEKQLGILAPIILAIESHLRATEAAGPKTPHDSAFFAAMVPRLHLLCEQLRAATTSPLGSVLQQKPVQCLKDVAGEVGKLLAVTQLALADVAPVLAAFKGTLVPMPGAGEGVTIAGIAPAVQVLHTKTRPKRLSLLGSDGKRYDFLLKVCARWWWVCAGGGAGIAGWMMRPRS